MRIVKVDPVERLPNLAETTHEQCHLMVNLPRYCCPHCNEYSVFSLGGDVRPPLSLEVRRQFDEFTPTTPPEGYWFEKSDFLCRVCSRPVRVIYLITEIHMAAYVRYAHSVLETAV